MLLAICKPKTKGGLGIRLIEDWNWAGMLKLFWVLASGNPSLWADWMRLRYLRRKSIWTVNIPADCSWAFRGILSVREPAKAAFRMKIGDGRDTELWYAPWLPDGPIIDSYGNRVRYSSGIPEWSKVSTFICNGQWNLPVPASLDFEELFREISKTELPPFELPDKPIWTLTPTGNFSIYSAWLHIIQETCSQLRIRQYRLVPG